MAFQENFSLQIQEVLGELKRFRINPIYAV